MENPIRQNLYKIGEILRTLGDNMCQEAQSKEELNFRKMFNPHLLDLYKTILKFPSDLDEWRQQIEKEQKKRQEPICYPKGYVETYEDICAFWDQEDAYDEQYRRNQSEIYIMHSIINELISEDLFPKDSDNPTFTFREALWKIAWQLRRLEDLFPSQFRHIPPIGDLEDKTLSAE
ncbi:MAG: hypothetical protein K2L45_02170 [Muribaculaceae bacterium]|nr:hypothetical protein [Muribaculaceae bacterium]MDE6631908.1 hypothetical protein [Muribaculaceae bacterium]